MKKLLLALVALALAHPAIAADVSFGVLNTEIGKMEVFGSTSGQITLQPQAVAGTFNWNWPTTAGTSGQPLLSGGGSSTAMTWGSISGNTTTFATTTGTLTSTHCVNIDASGNLKDAGTTCGGTAAQIIGGGVVASQGANTIKQYAPSGISTGQTNTTANFSIAARGGTFKNLYFSAQNTPAQANSYIITLFTGTAGGTLTATTLTCTVVNTTDTSCNDTTHTVTVTAGQAFVISINVLVGATALSGSNWGVEFDPT